MALRSQLRLCNSAVFHIEYRKFLTNHVAHGLVAVARVCAAADVPSEDAAHALRDFRDAYVKAKKLLPPVPPGDAPPLTAESWKAALGTNTRFVELVDVFSSRLKDVHGGNTQALIAEALPDVVGGLPGAALHGVIHAGFGVEAVPDDDGHLLCEGLAYMAFSSMPWASSETHGYDTADAAADDAADAAGAGAALAPAPAPAPATSPPASVSTIMLSMLEEVRSSAATDVLEAHYGDPDLRDLHFYTDRGFQVGMYVLTQHGQGVLQPVVDRWCADLLRHLDPAAAAAQVFDAVVEVYVASKKRNDFFLLHLVTATWSLRQLLPALDDVQQRKALHTLLLTVAAAFVVQGQPRLEAGTASAAGAEATAAAASVADDSGDTWRMLLRRAVQVCASGAADEHVVKLVFVCHRRAVEEPCVDALMRAAANAPFSTGFEFGVMAV